MRIYKLTPITETAAQVTKVKGQKGKIAKQFVLGHISDDPLGQIEELTAAAKAGADGIVLVTNRLDPKATGTETFRGRLKELLDLCHSHNVLVSKPVALSSKC